MDHRTESSEWSEPRPSVENVVDQVDSVLGDGDGVTDEHAAEISSDISATEPNPKKSEQEIKDKSSDSRLFDSESLFSSDEKLKTLETNISTDASSTETDRRTAALKRPRGDSDTSVELTGHSHLASPSDKITKSSRNRRTDDSGGENVMSDHVHLCNPISDIDSQAVRTDQISLQDNLSTDSPQSKRARIDMDLESSRLQGIESVATGEIASVTPQDLVSDDSDRPDSPSEREAAASIVDVGLTYNLSKPPVEICSAKEEFRETNNYLKGCKWSPDGSCLLTCSSDCTLRLFNLPEPLLRGEMEGLADMRPVLQMEEGETIYDYAWYPLMSSADPPSCCLVSTSGNTPVHMWDAFTGELRCSYRAYNHVDEVVPAYSVSFSREGRKLYCGFNKRIRVFDVERPGRDCQERPTYVKEGQTGIISCIVSSPTDTGLYAAGSYSRSIALYHEPKGDMACMFEGQQGGVTHIQFTPDGTKLLSGGRKDSEILCWDLRNPGHILFTAQRNVETNQRIYFDIDSSGRYLITGNHDGTVRIWDMLSSPLTATEGSEPILEPVLTYQAHSDTVNGVSFHPSMPLIATSSGQRHFKIPDQDSDDEASEESSDMVDNSVRLWYI